MKCLRIFTQCRNNDFKKDGCVICFNEGFYFSRRTIDVIEEDNRQKTVIIIIISCLEESRYV